MKLQLPNSAFIGNIESFLKKLDPADPDVLSVTFNPKWVSVHPVVLSMVACLADSAIARGIQPEVKVESIRSLPYLVRMGLFDRLGVPPPMDITAHEAAGRFIPLTQIGSSIDLDHCLTDLIPLLHASRREALPIKYMVSELVRNVLEHARSPVGAYICAQYYRKSDRIAIGVADAGIGVMESMKIHSPADHLSAIVEAMKPGVTGTTKAVGGTSYNAGAGLFFVRNIAKASRNYFLIYSGNAMYKLLKVGAATPQVELHFDPMHDRSSHKRDLPYWQGTAIGVDISIQSTAEFDVLLEQIRSVYFSDVDKLKMENRKRARFI